MAAVGTLGFNFQAILPLLARFTFEGGPGAYAALVCAMAVGAIAGALFTGTRKRVSHGLLAGAAIAFGGLALLAAGAPTLALELAALAPLGAASVMLAASINSLLQLASDSAMRGRVMALYSIVFLGSTPIGAPLAGYLSEILDPRAALVLAGVAGIVAGLGARAAFARIGADHAQVAGA
jgi:MFS family permease